jgi:hypothetical protein
MRSLRKSVIERCPMQTPKQNSNDEKRRSVVPDGHGITRKFLRRSAASSSREILEDSMNGDSAKGRSAIQVSKIASPHPHILFPRSQQLLCQFGTRVTFVIGCAPRYDALQGTESGHGTCGFVQADDLAWARLQPKALGRKQCAKFGVGGLIKELRHDLPSNGAGPYMDARREGLKMLVTHCRVCGRCKPEEVAAE